MRAAACARGVWSFLLAGLTVLATVSQALACTGITLVAADGSVVRGRTLEFGRPMDSDVILIPRGMAFTGTTPDGMDDGLQWAATYAAAGANGLGLPIIVDGLNEKGLGGGLFYFPDFAGYQEVTADEREQTIAPWQPVTWALTSFATVAEVKAALPDIRVGNVTLGAWGIVPPAHFILTDATGKSIVIEYVNGALNAHDNPLGVFTNAPTFDWHMTNLRDYISISPDPQGSLTVDGVDLDPLSTGGNLFGMPGDFSSPSRFVRATIYAKMSPQKPTGADAVMQGFHILDQFDIPEGAMPEPKGSEPPCEITEWTTMSDLEALTIDIWTTDNRAIRTLDLTQVDLDGSQLLTFALDQEQTFVDLAAT